MSVRSVLAAVCVGAALAVGVGAGLGGCSVNIPGWQQAAHQELRESWAPIAAQQAVTIESANGAIIVREAGAAEGGEGAEGAGAEGAGGAGGGNQVKITAEIRAITEERLALTEVRAERQADGSLLIRVEWPEDGRKGNEGAHLEIDLPAGAATSIQAKTSNGRIELTGLQTPEGARLKSSNGAIVVRGHTGDINADTSNGAVTIEGASAAVEAHSSNGRIEISQAPGAGSITANTSNGPITIDLASGFTGAISGRTSNGSVTLPQGEDVTVVRSERRDKAVRVGDGEGAGRVEARTSNGVVEIRR